MLHRGRGPAGAVLALLLARKGIAVMLLEAHTDFDRDFRGDTVHPSTMEIMDELDLAERLLQLPHTKIHSVTIQTSSGPVTPIDFRRLHTRYPYVTLMPQVEFLNFVVAQASRYPHFRLVMGARVEELIDLDGVVRGVRYQGQDGWHEVWALLTVGTDGRFSRLRKLAGLEPIKTSPPIDVLWFRLPRRPDDPEDAMARFSNGRMLILLNRYDTWQIAFIIPKGRFQQIRSAGIEQFRQAIAEMAPEFTDRVDHLHDWPQISVLSVAADRLERWYRPGLLLIGDAAHVMSPVGGVGINYAIQDAVVAANVLSEPLKQGRVTLHDLRTVQRKRELPTRLIQALQAFLQKQVVRRALNMRGPLKAPRAIRYLLQIPVVGSLPARIMAFGIWPVHVKG